MRKIGIHITVYPRSAFKFRNDTSFGGLLNHEALSFSDLAATEPVRTYAFCENCGKKKWHSTFLYRVVGLERDACLIRDAYGKADCPKCGHALFYSNKYCEALPPGARVARDEKTYANEKKRLRTVSD